MDGHDIVGLEGHLVHHRNRHGGEAHDVSAGADCARDQIHCGHLSEQNGKAAFTIFGACAAA